MLTYLICTKVDCKSNKDYFNAAIKQTMFKTRVENRQRFKASDLYKELDFN